MECPNGTWNIFIDHHLARCKSICVGFIDVQCNFLHAIAKSSVDNESREIFLFREGSLVAWNVSDAEVGNLMQFVSNFEMSKYDNAVVHDEIEVMPYTYSINR